jgi:hypothetical protein
MTTPPPAPATLPDLSGVHRAASELARMIANATEEDQVHATAI